MLHSDTDLHSVISGLLIVGSKKSIRNPITWFHAFVLLIGILLYAYGLASFLSEIEGLPKFYIFFYFCVNKIRSFFSGLFVYFYNYEHVGHYGSENFWTAIMYISFKNNKVTQLKLMASNAWTSAFLLSLFYRLLMCHMCNDPYSVDAVLHPFLSMQSCNIVTNDRYHVIQFDTYIADNKRKVEVILASYHEATLLRDEFCHGYIMCYSVKRKASYSVIEWVSCHIGEGTWEGWVVGVLTCVTLVS